MPSRLHQELASKQILDVGEIFWSTRYKYDETSVSSVDSPIFKPIYSVERWLGLWCRHLSLKSNGAFSEVFLGLRGAVRLYAELGHFLLPYLLVDLLNRPPGENENIQDCRDKIMEEMLLEVSTVLSGSSVIESDRPTINNQKERTLQMIEQAGISAFRAHNNIKSQMSIHAIFTLLDTLTRWLEGFEGKHSGIFFVTRVFLILCRSKN